MSWSGNTLNASNAFTGSGTNGQVAYWNSATGLTSSSALLNNGTVVGVNATSSTINLLVQGTGSNIPFQVNSSTGTSLLTVLGNGNVGIGTTGPGAKLEVAGTGTDILRISSSNTSYTSLLINNTDTFGRNWILGASSQNTTLGTSNFAIYDATVGATRMVIIAQASSASGRTILLLRNFR